jgi:hypothetical protein
MNKIIMKKQVLAVIIGFAVSCAILSPSLAQYCRWVDENGILHIVNHVELVPEKYKDQITIIQPSLEKITRSSVRKSLSPPTSRPSTTVTPTGVSLQIDCEEPLSFGEDGACLIIKWWLQENLKDREFTFLDVSPVAWFSDRWLQRVRFRSKSSLGVWIDKDLVFYLEGCGADARIIGTDQW